MKKVQKCGARLRSFLFMRNKDKTKAKTPKKSATRVKITYTMLFYNIFIFGVFIWNAIAKKTDFQFMILLFAMAKL